MFDCYRLETVAHRAYEAAPTEGEAWSAAIDALIVEVESTGNYPDIIEFLKNCKLSDGRKRDETSLGFVIGKIWRKG